MTVNSTKGLAAQTGIKGKLGTFKNHGVNQVTLGGKPLYYFTPDIKSHNKKMATGDQLKTFGSIWHIVKASGPTQSTPSPRPTRTHRFPRATSRRPRPSATPAQFEADHRLKPPGR